MPHLLGLMALVTAALCYWFKEGYAVSALVFTAVLSLLPGQLLYRGFRHAEKMRLRHAMVTSVIAWALIPLLRSLPFFLIADGLARQPTRPESVAPFGDSSNAIFKSMSGLTGTGLAMAMRPSELPSAFSCGEASCNGSEA